MSDKSRSLKNLFIDPKFQLKLMSYFAILFLITTVCLYSTTYLFFWTMKSKALNVGIPEGHVYYNFLLNQKHDLDMLFLGLAAFNFILLLSVGFLISHRIAGPLYKMRIYLQGINSLSENFKTRDKDFFQDLAREVNSLKDKVK